jgi:hypothetical protein
MKSKNDPILDAQQLCAESPKTEQEVLDGLKAFGWHEGVCKDALKMAKGVYVQEVDGKLVPRGGTTTEVVRKAMAGE